MRIDFYHLEKVNLDIALPLVMEKIYADGERAIIRTDSVEGTDFINTLLWTFDPDKWLPHGCAKDGNADKQPIFITDDVTLNPNNAKVLVVLAGQEIDFNAKENKDFEHVVVIFSAQDLIAKDNARKMWQAAKAAGHDIYYIKR